VKEGISRKVGGKNQIHIPRALVDGQRDEMALM